MKGKPIEPGCLAMIVGAVASPENNGRVVRVVRRAERMYIPPGISFKPSFAADYDHDIIRWVVVVENGAPPLLWCTVKRDSNPIVRSRAFFVREREYPQKQLIRLDGDEEPKTVSTAHTKGLYEAI